jgi:hypothetical protein
LNLPAASFRIRAEVTDSGSEDGSGASTATKSAEKSEVDKLIEGMSFGQLCDEFECISSPAVEKTARQLVKDIMSVREDKRSLGNFGMNVVYKVHCCKPPPNIFIWSLFKNFSQYSHSWRLCIKILNANMFGC